MEFICDPHVKKVLEFMQSNLPADKLVGVAHGVAELAPILWGQYECTPVSALQLEHPLSELTSGHRLAGHDEPPLNNGLRRRVGVTSR